MPKFDITDKLIHGLRPPQTGNRIVWADVPGFGVRISSGGAVAFVYTYRNAQGVKRLMKIGTYPATSPAQARTKAIKLRNIVENGGDPLEEKLAQRDSPTVTDLAVEYMSDGDVLKKRASTLRNERQMLDGIVKPKLGTMKVAAIGRAGIAKLHKSLEATPYRANRVLALLSTMFSFAIEQHWCEDNPCRGIKKFPEEKRNRWLTEDELQRLSAALQSYTDQNAANAIRLLLLTGARENEVLQSTWDEFDLERGTWTKPSHHTKQKRTEHVALSDAAVELLRKMQPRSAAGPLFPGANGIDHARVTVRRPWVQVCKAAGLVEAVKKQGKRHKLIRYKPTLRIHDLRHNFASHLVSNGVSLHIVGKLLGHTQPQTTARYAHLADSPLREAANKFGSIARAAAARA